MQMSTVTLETPITGISMFRAICAANEFLIAFSASLRHAPGVSEVTTNVDSRDLVSGPYIALYTDIELECGDALTYWCELRPVRSELVIEGRLSLTDADGERTIRVIPDVPVDSTRFESQLVGIIQELTSGRDERRFCGHQP